MIEGPSVMYTTHHHAQPPMDNMVGNVIDGSGTINPAALNQSGVLATPTSLANTSPRGTKRSRSPDQYGSTDHGAYDDGNGNDNDESRPNKKRGRPLKTERGPDDLVLQHPGQAQSGQLPPTPVSAHGNSAAQSQQNQLAQAQALQSSQPSAPPSSAPKQTSPAKPASGKSVVKALPTVRDHTTDQLNPEGDEYLPREIDDAGEQKVAPNGRPLGTREYKCRTFLVPNRGDKLFMLATECARILGYRDSYLLFNKNRSLYKIIATQAEKDDLIHQDILPYSYRSRQIAIVTAKSMFRQFGSRVVVNGRRVRDDYWEAKARKQGFTEEDLAGEKRPGAQRREQAQASEAAAHAAAGHAPGNISYIDVPPTMVPGFNSHFLPMGGERLPMIDSAYQQNNREYSDIQRPRQEVGGPPYQDRTQTSPMNDIMNHAGHASDFSKTLNGQRTQRTNILNDYWKREHATSSPQETTAAPATTLSPHLSMTGANPQPMLANQSSQQYAPHPGPSQGSPQAIRSQAPPMPQRSSTMSSAYGQNVPPSPSGGNYPYPAGNYMQPAQQSPMSSGHTLPGYGHPQTAGHPSQPQSPHPSQSPQNMAGAGAATGHAGQPGMPPPQQMYSTMPPMGTMHQGYAGNMARPMYPSSPANYMPSNPHNAGGWQGGQQNWQQQY